SVACYCLACSSPHGRLPWAMVLAAGSEPLSTSPDAQITPKPFLVAAIAAPIHEGGQETHAGILNFSWKGRREERRKSVVASGSPSRCRRSLSLLSA
ncbi:unnamed protein product, partial [Bubo scandiacus]